MPPRKPPTTTTTKKTFHIRPANLSDLYKMGEIASKTYKNTPLDAYLSPHRFQHPTHHKRGYQHRVINRMLDARNLSFVACTSTSTVPVGYIQLQRIGDDEGARRQIAAKKSMLLVLLRWLWWVYLSIYDKVVGDYSADRENLANFLALADELTRGSWDVEGRRERWYVQSLVVLDEWQGNGLGSRLMAEGMRRAEAEGVVLSLEASAEGEFLYRKLGFELLARFRDGIPGSGDAGGVMMWTPGERRKEL